MKKTSVKMSGARIALVFSTIIVLALASCRKDDHHHGNGNPPASYTAEVVDKWLALQLRLIKNTTGVPNHAFSRHYSYSGVAALEALSPGLPSSISQFRRWNGLTGLPAEDHSFRYYYPANVNAALATINRAFFPNANANDKAAIDSLEHALNESFLAKESQERINKSAEFGKAVATAVFNWAETDGYKNANAPYTIPTGPGLWKPVPATASPVTPYWGNNRTIITGSISNAQPGAPIPYSTDPSSAFYKAVKKVYDVSLTLTDDQKAMAIFWRDVPGATSPGHWLSILHQVIKKTNVRLDKAVLAYAITGVSINDALISCWKTKYTYNVVRPVTYIREVMGYTNWNTFIGTPAHPEYSSGHASLSGAAAAAFEKIFGNIGSFTDHTYDYLGLAPRTYNSFKAIGEEAAISRLYGGIHYEFTLEAGLEEGRKVAANIFSNGIKN
jgi:hypothetical protein